MAKYRLLSSSELKEMEKEFVDYLVINGITADEWQNILAKDQARAEKIIDLFSDVVFEKILRGVKFILVQTKHQIISFCCKEKEILMLGLISNSSEIDLTNPAILQDLISNPKGNFETISSSKKYSKQREIELFDLSQKGGMISDGRVFKALESISKT